MLPLLYKSSSSILSPEGMQFVGRITKCEKCNVVEKLNGDYTLTASVSPNDELVDEIQNQRFLLAKPNPFDNLQFF